MVAILLRTWGEPVFDILYIQAIAEVQRRMIEIPLLTEKDLQIEKSTYKKAKRYAEHSFPSSLIPGLKSTLHPASVTGYVMDRQRLFLGYPGGPGKGHMYARFDG